MKVLSSPVVRLRFGCFYFSVVVDKHLCYSFGDMCDHYDLPMASWTHESAI